jgi:hypothetical protein
MYKYDYDLGQFGAAYYIQLNNLPAAHLAALLDEHEQIDAFALARHITSKYEHHILETKTGAVEIFKNADNSQLNRVADYLKIDFPLKASFEAKLDIMADAWTLRQVSQSISSESLNIRATALTCSTCQTATS